MPESGDDLHWFRRLLLLALGAGLLGGGLRLGSLVWSGALVYGWMVFAAAFMITIGATILWIDIVAPALSLVSRRFSKRRAPSASHDTHRGGGRVR